MSPWLLLLAAGLKHKTIKGSFSVSKIVNKKVAVACKRKASLNKKNENEHIQAKKARIKIAEVHQECPDNQRNIENVVDEQSSSLRRIKAMKMMKK